MPATAELSVDEFSSATRCQPCHPDHYREWRTSAHAYAMVDPFFRALVAVRQRDFGGERDAFCTQCHSAIGTRGRECAPGFEFEELSPVVLEGVTCEACHKISSLVRPYNSGHRLDPTGPMRGPIRDPAPSEQHASEHSALFESSELCAGCHDVVEFTGLPLERPFAEWSASPAAREGRTCQSCHMLSRTGTAAPGGPERTLHDHHFTGVDLPGRAHLDEADRGRVAERIRALLAGSARLSVGAPASLRRGAQLDVLVTVENLIDGHNLPTGSTFHRQLWVELSVTDASGQVLHRTGDLDPAGDLRDHFSTLDPYGDHDLIRFGSRFVDARGNPTVFPWLASEHFSTAIPPGYARTQTLFVETSSAAPGTAAVEARLLFRAAPPFLLRLLALEAEAEELVIYEIATASAAVSLE